MFLFQAQFKVYILRMKTVNRYSQLKLKHEVNLSNRIVIPPMASETATVDGFATPATFHHYQNLSKAKPGLLFVEYTYVDKSGRSETNQLGAHTDEHIPGLKKIVEIIHASGSVAGLQLSHGGGKTERALTDGVLMGPSTVAVPVKNMILENPSQMGPDEIGMWKKSFLLAAGRALAAGFDLIELHAAHGYGLNQWISPITNQRDDKYGKTTEGRMLLLLEIIELIQTSFPKLLISVRMPGQDFLESGLTQNDTTKIAKILEFAGVNILNISSGIGGWRRPSTRVGEGYLVEEAARIQSNVSIPVIGVGGITTGEYIDIGLKNNYFSLAAVGRAILADPDAWYKKEMSTRIIE